MKILYSPALLALLSLFLLNVSPLAAQTSTAARKLPFNGKLEAVDTSAQTITLSGKSARVFHLTSATKITDGSGHPATLASAVVGEDVGGSYTKDASGTMTLYSVRFGAKTGSKAASSAPAAATTPAPSPATPPPATPTTAAPAKTPAATPAAKTTAATAKAKKVRFSGKVVSVNASGNTLVVHGKADQTFTATSATKFTGATDLSGVTAGAKVSGTYSTSADGSTLTLDTLKVTK